MKADLERFACCLLRRLDALCTDCEDRNVPDIAFWMDRTRAEHPLAQYRTIMQPSGRGPEPKCLVSCFPKKVCTASAALSVPHTSRHESSSDCCLFCAS